MTNSLINKTPTTLLNEKHFMRFSMKKKSYKQLRVFYLLFLAHHKSCTKDKFSSWSFQCVFCWVSFWKKKGSEFMIWKQKDFFFVSHDVVFDKNQFSYAMLAHLSNTTNSLSSYTSPTVEPFLSYLDQMTSMNDTLMTTYHTLCWR